MKSQSDRENGNHAIGQLYLPEPLRSLFPRLIPKEEVPPWTVILAGLGVLSVAIGNGAILVGGKLAAPVNASLGIVVISEAGLCAPRISTVIQVLRDVQDARLTALAQRGVKAVEEQADGLRREQESFFGTTGYRSPKLVAEYGARIQGVRQQLHPLLVLENARLGALAQAAQTSAGAGVLVYRSGDAAVCPVLNGSPKSSRDLEFLNAAWKNQTPDPLRIDPRCLPTVRPVFASLFRCSPSAAAQIVCSENGLVREFAERAVFVHEPTGCTELPVYPVSDKFRQLVTRLVSGRDSRPQRRLELSRRAYALLMDYAREVEGHRLGRGRWVGEQVLLAQKLALVLHSCRTEEDDLISVITMREAIDLARDLSEQSFVAVQDLASKGGEVELRRKATHMLAKIEKLGPPVSPRTLFRTYEDSSKGLHQPTLDFLIRTGQVHKLEDGRIDLGPATSGGSL